MPQLATRPIRILAAPLGLARVIAGGSSRRGRSWLRVLVVTTASVVLALGLVVTPAAAVTSSSITLKPAVGPPTSTVTVTGTGFGASETVAVDFNAAPVTTATTSSTGTFSAAFTVPASTLPGRYPVTATGETSGLSATHNFLVRTNWPEFHFNPASTGFNPYENVIGPSNVSQLKTAWTAINSGDTAIGSSPAVANGVVYVGSLADDLYAFSATVGSANCSGTPKACTPLWTGTTGPISDSSPAVAHGVVYVTSTDGTLYAFSTTASSAHCSGIPPNKTCTPLWTAAAVAGGGYTSPVVANGMVYVSSGGGTLYAFSTAATSANCSGTAPNKTCTPLWTAPDGYSQSTPAVANGMVYVSGTNTLYAFSAAGTTGCSGTPTTCTPLWTAAGTSSGQSPAVANGVVYVGSAAYGLEAFSAAGTTGCSGTPTTCTPLWTAGTASPLSASGAVAVANGVVYASSDSASTSLFAFSTTASRAHCAGTPPNKTCTPLWTAAGNGWGGTSSPVVANGIVYRGEGGQLYAFSAAGTANCSGTPKTCTPLWTVTTNGNITAASPAVANGVVYEGQWDSNAGLYAYKP